MYHSSGGQQYVLNPFLVCGNEVLQLCCIVTDSGQNRGNKTNELADIVVLVKLSVPAHFTVKLLIPRRAFLLGFAEISFCFKLFTQQVACLWASKCKR